MEDNEHPGRHSTSKTDENVENFDKIVRNDRRLSIGMISDMININKETVRQILHNNL